jgi:IMP dehydrogenase
VGEFIGRGRKARRCYGFDEIALVPGLVTVDPEDVDISWEVGGQRFEIPIIAAAMDGVVDPHFAKAMGKLGGLAVLNLDGIYTRYKDPTPIISQIIDAPTPDVVHILQKIYREPIKRELIKERIKQIKEDDVKVAVSTVPTRAEEFGRIAQEAGADIFVVQGTVVNARHQSSRYLVLDFKKFCKQMNIPVMVGNCVTYEAALELMQTGIDALLVGVGPGAACTTRGVLGIGVPQVTATVDCAAARDFYYKRTGRYVPIITDGGMLTGGDVCKALAAGADAVMIGSAFAKAKEAPGHGYHWGMATPHQNLPRGTRVHVGITGTLEQILYGPAVQDDGSQNLVGAIRTCMGMCGAKNIKEMHLTEIIIAPAVKTEGKLFQRTQRIGMGK